MKPLFASMSSRRQRMLEFAAWGTLIFAILASAPFGFDVVGRSVGWIIGLLTHPDELWKECPWCPWCL